MYQELSGSVIAVLGFGSAIAKRSVGIAVWECGDAIAKRSVGIAVLGMWECDQCFEV